MRIAQISPLYESVPPRLYGGTERIVHFLTEELVRTGHEVTLFASGDSKTSAALVPVCGRALRLSDSREPVASHVVQLEQAFRRAGEFDVIHSHVDYLVFPFARRHPGVPVLATLHGRLDLPELLTLYQEYPEARLISISDSQRAPLPGIAWAGTVHHGLPPGLYRPNPKPGRYLAFLGRVSPEKGLASAIDIAVAAGIPLRIAAKVDRFDRDFFETDIRHRLDHPLVDFIGEIGEREKQDFLGNALALLFPIDWPEPFGLVMIEAMACGTPVIARRRGSVPEVMRHGVSGFVFEHDSEAVEAVWRVPDLSRMGCRRYFEERFAARRMAEDYVAIYQKAAEGAGPASRDWRGNGGSHPRQRRVLHPGQLLPGREAEPGPEGRRDLRRLR
ncbi:MAG TPA: glycosyltransferase family 4 protein [Fibrobacteria bacterium]|nr:glycosyltransferase family 4 protein [Fibrobacteria bacterium]